MNMPFDRNARRPLTRAACIGRRADRWRPGRAVAAVLAVVLPWLTGCDKIGEVVKKTKGARAKTGQHRAVTAQPEGPQFISALTAGEFDAFIARPGTVAVIDFHADWCGPCRQLGPVLEQVCSALGPQVALAKVNVDRERELAAMLGVRSIPDVRVFREGRQVDGFVGMRPEPEVRALLQAQLAKVPPVLPAGEDGDEPAEPPIQRMKKDWVPPGIERIRPGTKDAGS